MEVGKADDVSVCVESDLGMGDLLCLIKRIADKYNQVYVALSVLCI